MSVQKVNSPIPNHEYKKEGRCLEFFEKIEGRIHHPIFPSENRT